MAGEAVSLHSLLANRNCKIYRQNFEADDFPSGAVNLFKGGHANSRGFLLLLRLPKTPSTAGKRTCHLRSCAALLSTQQSRVALDFETTTRQRRAREFVIMYPQKKSPGRLHTWKNDRKAGRGAYRHTSVAAEFGINKSFVSRAWKAFQTTGTAVRKVGGGDPRTTTAGDDRYIILKAKRGRWQSASVIAQQLSTATGRQVSRFTVTRRLHKGGLFARHPERSLPLKVDH
ncbi:transposable element Tcb2 transposase [Trichonephila clavipes]|nr:transposable element Tcb2 transposase [Trichonephila clavipes]